MRLLRCTRPSGIDHSGWSLLCCLSVNGQDLLLLTVLRGNRGAALGEI